MAVSVDDLTEIDRLLSEADTAAPRVRRIAAALSASVVDAVRRRGRDRGAVS